MNKYELLRKVGFSEIFIEYLSKVEESDAYMHEIPEHINEQLSCDVNDYIVSESTNNFWFFSKRVDETATKIDTGIGSVSSN